MCQAKHGFILLCSVAAILACSAGPASSADAAAGSSGVAAGLPLTDVILYSSGVGYFERKGEVEGRAQIDLRFKADDINDLLKSMVVQDLNGGRVTAVN